MQSSTTHQQHTDTPQRSDEITRAWLKLDHKGSRTADHISQMLKLMCFYNTKSKCEIMKRSNARRLILNSMHLASATWSHTLLPRLLVFWPVITCRHSECNLFTTHITIECASFIRHLHRLDNLRNFAAATEDNNYYELSHYVESITTWNGHARQNTSIQTTTEDNCITHCFWHLYFLIFQRAYFASRNKIVESPHSGRRNKQPSVSYVHYQQESLKSSVCVDT